MPRRGLRGRGTLPLPSPHSGRGAWVRSPSLPKRGKQLASPSFFLLTLSLLLTAAAWGQRTVSPPRKAGTDFWSFRPIVRPPLPTIKNRKSKIENPIDAFILAKLEKKGLTLSPEADKHTLIRRVTFDLTGLPPSPEEIEAFLKDSSPDAYEKVVDRLLASPAYGERWGRHWLDVVRYTDSLDKRDTDTIRDINEAWRYRDWVVDALNKDLPFDQFILNQIAGDLLPGPNPGDINKDGTIATGMLAIGNWGNGDGDKIKTIANIADDQIDAVGRGFLGLTLTCARCHDHKFDPISMRDYYALAGFFYSSHILPNLQPNDAMETPLKIPLLSKAEWADRAKYDAELIAAKKRLSEISSEPLKAFARKMLPETAKYVLATWEFRNRPGEQAALTFAEFAKERGLEPALLRQWSDYFRVGDYKLLTVPVRDLNGIASVHQWKTDAPIPYLMMNTNPVARTIETAQIPPATVAVYPGRTNGVAVAWKSPMTGTVVIRGGVMDADGNGGDGVRWILDHRTAGGVREVASGAFEDGGRQPFNHANESALLNVQVKRGEMIQLLVLPKENADHDATLVLLEIVEARGARMWSLALDIAKDVLQKGKGNPHTDARGEPDVWHFFDMARSHRALKSTEAAETAQETWERVSTQSGGMNRREEVQQAAQRFANAFTVTDDSSPFWLHARADWHLLPATEKAKVEQAADAVETLVQNAPPPIPYANGVQEGGIPGSPYAGTRNIRLHIRGNHEKLGEVIPRRFPVVLAGEKQLPLTRGSGRLELAKWIASPSNPLTARVIVNRLWQHHFGAGIVRTPSNFGFLGERPTHPELLDWLASELIRQGWSLKKMHKLMVMSATYRQVALTPRPPSPDTRLGSLGKGERSGFSKQRSHRGDQAGPPLPQRFARPGKGAGGLGPEADPENRLLWRMNRRRLEAEALRDSLLAVTGKLDRKRGGTAEREFETPRRTLYLMTLRSGDVGFRPLFDGADPTAPTEKRVVSTVAPQALFLLNHPFVLAQAQALAERLSTEAQGDVKARIERAYWLLYGRPSMPQEVAIAETFLKQTAVSKEEEQTAWTDYLHILLCANEFLYVD
jgi:hypothetical protein